MSTEGNDDYIGLNIPAITQSVINNDAILAYINVPGFGQYSIPGIGPSSAYATVVQTYPQILYIYFKTLTGGAYNLPVGEIDEVKVVIIQSSSTTNGRIMQGKQQIYNELEEAGVDINDYYAVCDYYGIAY